MARDKILILITHRLYNLQIADLIITMDNGAIAEEGTFEVLSTNGDTHLGGEHFDKDIIELIDALNA